MVRFVPLKVLFYLEKKDGVNLMQLTNEIGSTMGSYFGIMEMVNKFAKSGIIRKEKENRRYKIYLTDKYWEMRNNMNMYDFLLEIEKIIYEK